MKVITAPQSPVKPLTEVERAFAAAKLLWIRSGAEDRMFEAGVTLKEAGAILGLRGYQWLKFISRRDAWREVKASYGGKGREVLYSLEDVMETARIHQRRFKRFAPKGG